MGEETREIEAPGERLRLRPAIPADEGFLFDLFRANRIGVLRLGGLAPPLIETLLTMQYRARTQSYRETYPTARWSILESAGEPIGELIACDEADGVYIVDVSLRPDCQGRGVGGALVRSIQKDCAGVRAVAAVGNAPSRKMFARLGFVESPCDEANVELRWRA